MAEEFVAGALASQMRRERIASLRRFADFLDAHPDVPVPYPSLVALTDVETLKRVARSGAWQKIHGDSWFMLRQTFGSLTFDLAVPRDTICRRVVTGTEDVPAQPAHTIERVEWVCEDSVLAPRP